jgi:hypothetical protein
MSAAYLENDQLRQKSLADGLGLPNDGYVIFRDGITNLEYIRSCREMREQGLYVELGAYKCHTFLDWRFVEDGNWGMVNGNLNGAGIPSMQGKYDEMFGVKDEGGMMKDEEESAALILSKGGKKKEGTKKRATVKKTAAKKPAEKKGASKKPAAKKPVTKKTAEKKTTKAKKAVKEKKAGG